MNEFLMQEQELLCGRSKFLEGIHVSKEEIEKVISVANKTTVEKTNDREYGE